MKKILFIFTSFVLTSCAVKNYYQIYKATAENGVVEKDRIVFENKDCSVYYYLWDEGGNIGFKIYNKTGSDMVIDLKKTFFILNGVANEYFQNREFSTSSSSAYSHYYTYRAVPISGSISSNSSGVTIIEKPEITIPPKTKVNISEYRVTGVRYPNCDLVRLPTSSSTNNTLKFDRSNSPFVFSNLISYRINGDSTRIENKFFINEVTNYAESKVFKEVELNKCGKRYEVPKKVFNDSLPDRFYIRYSK